MEFPYVVKATQKSGKPDAFVWFTAKTEARANLMLDVALEDAGIETGRGKDYAKPIRTDFPVVDDLPEEGDVDFTWCDRYELAEDQRTWNVKQQAEDESVDDADIEDSTAEESQQSEQPNLIVVATLPFRQRVLAQFIGDGEYLYHVDAGQKNEIVRLEMDTDDAYVQNLLLAAENVEPFKKAQEIDIHRVVNDLKKAFPNNGKTPELVLVIRFFRKWFDTPHIDRGLLVKEWSTGNRISKVVSPETKEKKEELPPVPAERYKRAVDQTVYNLNVESCIARMYPDAEPGSVTIEQLKAAKNLIDSRDDVQAKVIKVISHINDILEYDALSIFGVTRAIDWTDCLNIGPVILRDQARKWLAENGIYSNGKKSNGYSEWEEDPRAARHSETQSKEEIGKQLAAQRGEFVEGISDPDDPKWVKTETSQRSTETELVKNVGNGIFDVTALLQNSATHGTKKATETTSNVQIQETVSDEKQAGDALHTGKSSVETGEESHTSQQADVNQTTDSVAQNCDSVNQTEPVLAQTEPEAHSDEPAVVYPAYFEPGRYEDLPNEVYHAANGISSTQVKDARVSLMFYHGRHVTKTIRRESSEALTFGSLAHTLALEPEKLHEEFAVFPGIPAEAFTTTDSMKAFIREFNADKPKAEQLKLTGKKEELQAAIRAVSPEAIFADEFEQQWRDSVDGKTILSREQLTLATAIQQALLNHESAGKLLRHPSRSVETSYFGMDDETGLEVRVRPDLEVQINGVRIGVDLKTISMGRVKQDGLRAKLHREIIDRDYHLSAGMYCSVADFDQFFWIFVNKDEGYHWVAVIEASEDLLDLGLLEYQRTMRALANAYDTDCWSAPITEDYTDELNDFDLRRLEALRLA
jgi:exodeoxyribonuclease VIII